jgi:hypothetical protein
VERDGSADRASGDLPDVAPPLDAPADAGSASDAGPSADGFEHPGMVSSEAELARIRTIVNGAAPHPMKDGWNKLRATRYASLTYQPTPYPVVHVAGSGGNAEESAMRNDAIAAYAHAVQWAVLNDPQYSAKAIAILGAWSRVLTDVVPATAADPQVQDELETAWYAPMWLNAAELIRHHQNGAANWSVADRASFDRMVALFKAKADGWAGSTSCCPNQGISVALSRMSIGVYTGDRRYFDAAVTFFNSMVPRAISATGEVIEINRTATGDCSHATFNIEGIFDIAETAWHQGTDLYANPRLPLGLEYMAQLLTTGVATTSAGTVVCGTKPASIEIAYNHYTNRAGKPPLPHALELLTRLRPVDQGTGKFIPWDTLTHAELDK